MEITNKDALETTGASFYIHNDDYSSIVWNSPEITKPTLDWCQNKVSELQTIEDAQEYARNRKLEYDALNQFEMQFDDEENGTTTWKDAVNAIKAKYPKP